MKSRGHLFKTIRPYLLSGLLDDPLVFIRQKTKGANILLDCGQLNHVAKRTIKSIGAVLVTHTHMDHFIGFDQLIRAALVTDKTIIFVGPSGISRKIESKLEGYDWNLAEDFFVNLEVREVTEQAVRTFVFKGSSGFKKEVCPQSRPRGAPVFENAYLRASAVVCDHNIPCLAFKIEEKNRFSVCPRRLTALEIKPGVWLQTLKKELEAGREDLERTVDQDLLEMFHKKGILTNSALAEAIKLDEPVNSIGYVTDIGATNQNIALLEEFLKGTTLLFCECAFLSHHKDKARLSKHFCVEDLNLLINIVKPNSFVPIHLSKTYLDKTNLLYESIQIPDESRMIKIPDRVPAAPITPEQIGIYCGATKESFKNQGYRN